MENEILDKSKKKYICTSKKNAHKIIDILNTYYKDAKCGLNYTTPLELTVALILAAQCTDERVNKIVPLFFKTYPNVEAISSAKLNSIEQIIMPCGFYKNKAKSIKETANIILTKFNGNVPSTMEDLTSLKGIGRKSANIILQECFGKVEGIAVDTHVTRESRKMGFSNSLTQESIEKDLMKKFDKKYWNIINHILVYHGRKFCIARRPNCLECPVNSICPKND